MVGQLPDACPYNAQSPRASREIPVRVIPLCQPGGTGAVSVIGPPGNTYHPTNVHYLKKPALTT
jgi:hypothetical protein